MTGMMSHWSQVSKPPSPSPSPVSRNNKKKMNLATLLTSFKTALGTYVWGNLVSRSPYPSEQALWERMSTDKPFLLRAVYHQHGNSPGPLYESLQELFGVAYRVDWDVVTAMAKAEASKAPPAYQEPGGDYSRASEILQGAGAPMTLPTTFSSLGLAQTPLFNVVGNIDYGGYLPWGNSSFDHPSMIRGNDKLHYEMQPLEPLEPNETYQGLFGRRPPLSAAASQALDSRSSKASSSKTSNADEAPTSSQSVDQPPSSSNTTEPRIVLRTSSYTEGIKFPKFDPSVITSPPAGVNTGAATTEKGAVHTPAPIHKGQWATVGDHTRDSTPFKWNTNSSSTLNPAPAHDLRGEAYEEFNTLVARDLKGKGKARETEGESPLDYTELVSASSQFWKTIGKRRDNPPQPLWVQPPAAEAEEVSTPQTSSLENWDALQLANTPLPQPSFVLKEDPVQRSEYKEREDYTAALHKWTRTFAPSVAYVVVDPDDWTPTFVLDPDVSCIQDDRDTINAQFRHQKIEVLKKGADPSDIL